MLSVNGSVDDYVFEKGIVMVKRIFFSFSISALCGLFVYLLLELIAGVILGVEGFSAMTPEYIALFPSETIALEVAILAHGVIGAVFAVAAVVYEKAELGFILQNVIYVLITGIVWIPLFSFVYQLYRYPSAMIGTVCGFVATYVVMSVVGYRVTKKEIAQINQCLEKNS